ncbi:MAG: hypothetical protein IT364_24630 [Candidatus Hydrogenedentes bacterium]|nr:hypothetical protein [Candidatus Hydrogenedentota bacterium]
MVRISNDDAAMFNAEIARLQRALSAEQKAFADYRENSAKANRVVAAVIRWRMCTSETSSDEFALKKLAVLTAVDNFLNRASPNYITKLYQKSATYKDEGDRS